MENTITLNMENLSKSEKEQLMKLVKKANKQENNNVWKPENNEIYWYISDTKIDYSNYTNDRIDRFYMKWETVLSQKKKLNLQLKEQK